MINASYRVRFSVGNIIEWMESVYICSSALSAKFSLRDVVRLGLDDGSERLASGGLSFPVTIIRCIKAALLRNGPAK